jgi:hypothetical protein
MIEKREHVRPTITVRPDGPLAGHEFTMTRIGARDWIAMRRGERDDGELAALAAEAVVDSSLPDGTELDLFEVMALMRAWLAAHRETALPPASGTDSPAP